LNAYDPMFCFGAFRFFFFISDFGFYLHGKWLTVW
jgi:hypothetical protein